MLHSLLSFIDRTVPFTEVSAHCDIPCKIYDPSAAQIAALTVIRMIDLIAEFPQDTPLTLSQTAQLGRLVAEKERHAMRVKAEIQVIWGDYFKAPQFEQEPQIHDLVHNIMLQASIAKQCIDKDEALKLLELVNDFTETFWRTKDIESAMAPCPYPPEMPVVYPKLV